MRTVLITLAVASAAAFLTLVPASATPLAPLPRADVTAAPASAAQAVWWRRHHRSFGFFYGYPAYGYGYPAYSYGYPGYGYGYRHHHRRWW